MGFFRTKTKLRQQISFQLVYRLCEWIGWICFVPHRTILLEGVQVEEMPHQTLQMMRHQTPLTMILMIG
jgi:hypothetical protein